MGVRGATPAVLFRVCAFLLLLSASCSSSSASPFSSGVCWDYDDEEYLVLQENLCTRDGDGDSINTGIVPRVAEVNGTTLESALKVLHGKVDVHAAVLYYANWCPFSRALRPLLDTLSSNFPKIYHIAVEDSAIQRSVLSQQGVHSFPVLFLHSKTAKVKYQGPRTVKAISEFYEAATGIKPFTHSKRESDGIAFIESLSKKVTFQGKVDCPYPWVKSPEKWLHDDMYLQLATLFLVVRILVYSMPRLCSSLKQYWVQKQYSLPRLFRSLKHYWVQKECSLEAHKVLLRRVLLREQDSVIRSPARGSFESERARKGKAVLSVPGWSSSPLAAVTLAEGSSSKIGSVEVARENGRAFTSHFWG